MSISATSARLDAGLVSFAWREWSQLGVFATEDARSPWAQDVESLLVFTLEVARSDPRLFDAILDWLLVNEHYVSVRRWRTLADDPLDRQLTDATIAWLARHRPRARFSTAGERGRRARTDLVPVHPAETGFPITRRDEAFAVHGLLRADTPPTGHSRPPDLRLPIALSLRLRQLLGVGARAEIVRVLLTSPAPRVTAAALARSAAFAKRNVQEALHGLVDAGVVDVLTVGGEQRYGIDRPRWTALLGIENSPPAYVDWVQLLRGLRRLVRWLRDHPAETTGDAYLLSSDLRLVLGDLRGDFEYAGIAVARRGTADHAVDDLEDLVRAALGALGVGE